MIQAWLELVAFIGGIEVPLERDSILVIVGPNNSGKSATLSGLVNALSGAPEGPKCSLSHPPRGKFGQPVSEIQAALEPFRFGSDYALPGGHRINESRLRGILEAGHIAPLGGLLSTFLSTGERLNSAAPAPWPPPGPHYQYPQHPFLIFYRDAELEAQASAITRRAFKQDLVVQRLGGQTVPVHIGQKPIPKEGEDRLSPSYLQRIDRLDRLDQQGDGVRSFVSIVSRIVAEQRPMLFIDEPEAFLHPPQARMIAEAIAEHGGGRQTFIATHSSDVLQGLLTKNSTRVQVVRLSRVHGEFSVSHMPSERIVDLWKDPILRFSNVLDGLFHDGVVVAEADGDCRFYEAMTAAAVPDDDLPDIHYTYSGGKDRIPLVVKALRSLNVPVASVLDFDVLNGDQPLRNIVLAHGGDWSEFEPDLKALQKSVAEKVEFLAADRLRQQIQGQLDLCHKGGVAPAEVLREIRKLTRKASPWDAVKGAGLNALALGGTTVVARRLLDRLKSIGIFVAPLGEMEGFCRTIEAKKNRWVEEVLRRSLSDDPDLAEARKFVAEIAAFIRGH